MNNEIKIGQFVKFRIPYFQAPWTQPRAGVVKAEVAAGVYEVRGQDGGIYKVRAEEIK